jgi:hypothetical protein
MNTSPHPVTSVVAYIVMLLMLTPLVMVGWNGGLVPAGFVANGIDWTTALCLGVCLLLARTIVSAASSTVITVNSDKA